MNNFTFYAPTKVVFGKNSECNVGMLCKDFGASKILIHFGGGSVEKSGLLNRIKKSLDGVCIPYVQLGGVVPNPRLSLVREGMALCKKENVDFILAVGGGSVIDSAKAIGYGVTNDFDVWDIFEKKNSPKNCLPIGVVLTLAASGSEMSNSAVITNEDGWKKRGSNSDFCRPKFAIMNPELTMTLPKFQTMCGSTDILMHTMERYFTSNGNMQLTDGIAESLMRTVISNTRILLKNPNDYDARAEIMWAGSLSHNDLTGLGNGGNDFATHRLEHELSGMFDVAHGAGLSALWGTWARYVYKDCLARFKKFAIEVWGVKNSGTDEEIALKGIEATEDFYREINMPTNLRELGVKPTDEQITELAKKCAIATGGKVGNAKVLYEEDMRNIYEAAR
ncbi:iron-containing alcohol dehydrogenase [Treponema zioleckii]|uniref:iron-containing alcohol dehydrogenase n=1 Tax=Treponema zioleckii TaxID=331680 RepID=UPI00168B06C5|nr:iron-containing alcohol dehydrogenase [Treponema zioleckii]